MRDEDIISAYTAHAPPRAARALSDLGAGIAVSANGATVRTRDKRSIVDLTSSGFDYDHPTVVARTAEQLATMPLSGRMFLSRPLAKVVAALARLTPGELAVTYLCNSSAEALDGALKLARGYHRRRTKFVAAAGAHHGVTLGALSVCGIPRLRPAEALFPLRTSFVPYGDVRAIDEIDRDTAAVIVEPVATGCGVHLSPRGWLPALRERCSRTGALLIADETTTGLGATGAWFGVSAEDVVPDILVLGNALGGGVIPMAAYVATHAVNYRVYGRRNPALHGSTTGGNPTACAAALAALDVLEEEQVPRHAAGLERLIAHVLERWRERFDGAMIESAVRGLLAGVRLSDPTHPAAIREVALAHGALVRDAGDGWIAIRPPLLVTRAELERGLNALERACSDVLTPARSARHAATATS